MNSRSPFRSLLLLVSFAAALLGAASSSLASFHLMQIEQVIGGVNGDTSCQAIQLRMRSPGQQFVSQGRLRAFDANGLNPIMLLDLSTNVAIGNSGSRVLIATNSFISKTSPTCVPDFIMTNPIPASYLAAGRITWEFDGGVIYWSLSFGGAAYTGSNIGNVTNDADGNFGPPFGSPCPSNSLQALRFTGAATAPSTANLADYAITSAAAVFTNNAGASFTVISPCTPPSFTQQPDASVTVRNGQSAQLHAAASGSNLQYHWRRNTVPLSDTGEFSGALTDTLTINPAGPADTATFDLVISNTCGSLPSAPSSVRVLPPCGTADFNGDGDTGTDSDIEAFFACLAGNCCPLCGNADFNSDGDIGTDSDIEAFFRVLAGGVC